MASKKKHTLSLKRKIELINEVESSPFKRKKVIAEEFGIPHNTLSTIMKNKEKYKEQFRSSSTDPSKQRRREAIHAVGFVFLHSQSK